MTDSSYDEHGAAQVLKTDVLGRVKTCKAQRERLLDEFERSGLSGTKFAGVAGVNYQTFASWVQKRRRATGAYAKAEPLSKPALVKQPKVPVTGQALQWLEAVVAENKQECAITDSHLKLQLLGGVHAEIHHARQIPLAVELISQLKLRVTPAC
jgi:hypothetical protein